MNELIQPFKESLYTDGIEDVAVDFADITLDQLTGLLFDSVSDAFLNLPIVKWATSVGKIGWSISQAVSLRKQLVFIQSLQKENVKPEALEKRRRAIEYHEKWIEKEIETSVIYLERYANVKKAVYQERMYRDLLNEKITFEEYEEYLAILDQLLIGDAAYLLDVISFVIKNQEDIYNLEKVNEMAKHFDKVRCGRLQALGLLEGIITSRVGSSTVDRYMSTDRGDYMYSILREENDSVHPRIIIQCDGENE